MTSRLLEKKTAEAVYAYLVKNSKGGGVTLTSSQKDWAELYG